VHCGIQHRHHLGYGPGTGEIEPIINVGSFGDGKITYVDYGIGDQTDTRYLSGIGGWESFELVVKFGPADENDKIAGTFDLYFSRSADSSEGALAKTKIISDAAMGNTVPNNLALTRWLYVLSTSNSIYPDPYTVYVDNVTMDFVDLSAIAGDFNLDLVVNDADIDLLAA